MSRRLKGDGLPQLSPERSDALVRPKKRGLTGTFSPVLGSNGMENGKGPSESKAGSPGRNADLHVEYTTTGDLKRRLEEHAGLYERPPIMPEVTEQ